jgi:DNA-binding MarR family transcriptional regulator
LSFGLTRTAAAGDEAMSITALANSLGMDRSTLTRNLRPLEKEGLIVLGQEGRHRSRALEVTKAGRARMRAALPLWTKAQAALKAELGERNWNNIHGMLDRLIEAA